MLDMENSIQQLTEIFEQASEQKLEDLPRMKVMLAIRNRIKELFLESGHFAETRLPNEATLLASRIVSNMELDVNDAFAESEKTPRLIDAFCTIIVNMSNHLFEEGFDDKCIENLAHSFKLNCDL